MAPACLRWRDLERVRLMFRDLEFGGVAGLGVGVGMSTVEVKRGDNNMTFVDEIFATCIDSPNGAMVPMGRR